MTQVDIHIQRKAYKPGAPAAIEDLHLSLAPGEFVCLVGPSGCGKTTLLNLVAGLDRDYQAPSTSATGKALRRSSAMSSKIRACCLAHGQGEHRLGPARRRRSDVDELLRILGLEAAQHVYPQRLSLGMSRRAAIARAFAVEPDLLLMDEPFVSLDPPTRAGTSVAAGSLGGTPPYGAVRHPRPAGSH